MNRRSFLRGIGASGFLLATDGWLGRAIARAQGESEPLKLVQVHRPNGTIDHQWLTDGRLGPILEPFADLEPRVIRGLRIATANGGGSTHEGGMVTLATGAPIGSPRPPSPDDWRNTARSLDRRLAESSPHLVGARFPTLELTAHGRQEGAPEVANRTLTYDGPDLPIYPESSPSRVYQRLFSGFMPGGDTDENWRQLALARRRRASVLDFASADLARLRRLAPSSERARLDAHEAAIRELEMQLDDVEMPDVPTCTAPASPPDLADTDAMNDVRRVGEAQLAIARAALACDLTNVVTFLWSAAASRVNFTDLYPGMGTVQHHALSHRNLDDASVWRPMAAIDRWYAERTAEFVRALGSQPAAGGGSLLDRTLVVYLSEVSRAHVHSFTQLPVVLFGGSHVGLAAGPVIDVGDRSTNDLWLSIARRFEAPITTLGTADQGRGPIEGIFARSAG